MKRFKFALGILACLIGVLAVAWVLQSEHTLVFHPKGPIAEREMRLILTNVALMLVIIIPTYIVLYRIAWKYRSSNKNKEFDPDSTLKTRSELMMWIVPSIIVIVMSIITWFEAHKLDPFRPLESEKKPLTIQVVALDWKWLFIYPEQGIATVNFVQFPDQTPIRFALSADDTPMNSFWIPSLSGQIYSMTGMTTILHMMADAPGEYMGKAAEINGEGYAGMTFTAKSSSHADFEAWVRMCKESPLRLDWNAYNMLAKRSVDHPVALYSHVDKDLFEKIVLKPMQTDSRL